MKTICLAAVLAAQPATDLNAEHSTQDTCVAIGNSAETIMESRQLGRPLTDVTRQIDIHVTDDDQREFFREIAFDAYGQHPMRTAVNARRQRDEFRAKWELACFRLFEG